MERSSSQLQNKVNNIINATGGHDGGLIFGTSSGLFEGIRLENLKHVYESVRKSGVTQGNVPE
jgi:uroporphyrinogen decarboxylase